MANTFQPNLVNSLKRLVVDVTDDINLKFTRFYNSTLVDLGLVIKTFTYSFTFTGAGNGSYRRSVTKFKQLLIKYIQKLNPVLAFASEEYICNANQENIQFNIATLKNITKVPKFNITKFNAVFSYRDVSTDLSVEELLLLNGAYLQKFFELTDEYGSLFRYSRYLNYIFRKYSIPLSAEFRVTSEFTSVENPSSVIKLNFSFEFMKHICRGSSSRIEIFEKIKSGELVDDSFYADETNWVKLDLSHVNDALNKDTHISKVFLNLKKGLVILNTLSRKIDYEYNAFDFRVGTGT